MTMPHHPLTRLGLRLLLLPALLLPSGPLLAQGIVPQVWLDPSSAPPGAVVAASGTGYPADTAGEIIWPDGPPLAAFVTDATGAFAVSLPIPAVAPGTYTVRAVAGTGDAAVGSETTLAVEAPPPMPPTDAPAPTEPPTYAITSSSHSDNSPDASVAYDGDPATIWITDPVTPEEASFTLDLGTVQPIGSARWQLATAGTISRLEILLSQDGTTWGSLVTLDGWSMPIGSWVEQPVDVWARYVRFVASNQDGLTQLGGIAEVELWPAIDARPLEAIITPPPEPPIATDVPATDVGPTPLPTEPPINIEPATVAPTAVLPAVTGQGTIGGTSGQGAYCYTAPDATSGVLVILPDGSLVELIGEPRDQWQQVACAGQAGWIGTTFVQPPATQPVGTPGSDAGPPSRAAPSTEGSAETPSPTPAEAAGSAAGPAQVNASAATPDVALAAAQTGDAAVGSIVFTPDADARVEQLWPTRNFGTARTLTAGTFFRSESYLRFTVSGITGPVEQATLRLSVTNGTTNGPSVAPSSNTTWSETGITWNTRPRVGTGIGNADVIPAQGWVEYDVTPLIAGNGVFTLALVPDASDSLTVNSREASENAPQLVIIPATPAQTPAPLPTPTPMATMGPTEPPASTPTMAPTASPVASAVPTGDGAKPTCIDSLQREIDAAPVGGTVRVRADCIYREFVTLSRPITLDGQGAAEIRGSDVWTEWSRQGGGWVSNQSVPSFYTHGTCLAGSDCLTAEQVFRDGVPLQQAATGSSPGAGQFALTSARYVVLGDDPAGSTVEVTTRPRWVTVTGSDVVIQGITMTHAAADAQTGGINIQGARNWTVRNSTLSYAHGANVAFQDAPNGRVTGSDLSSAGQIGITGISDGIVIANNRIHNNNIDGFDPGWEAGGIKIMQSANVTVEGNTVENNAGPGIWCDINCTTTTIRNNIVRDNLGIGIFFEISDGAEIAGNYVWENAWSGTMAMRTWAYEAGILVSSASNANVHDNIVAWNGDGIAVISQCRTYLANGSCDLSHPWNNVSGNTVRDNVIVIADDPLAPYNVFALAWLRDITGSAGTPYTYIYSAEAGNGGAGNRYWIPQPEGSTKVGFSWGDTVTSSLSAFNATPGEEGGSYLSDTERDQILGGAGMPTSPASHASTPPTLPRAAAGGWPAAWLPDAPPRVPRQGRAGHRRAHMLYRQVVKPGPGAYAGDGSPNTMRTRRRR